MLQKKKHRIWLNCIVLQFIKLSTYLRTDQLAYLNSSENNDLLEEIFAETQPNECTIQNDAADERQAILMDFDCSVFECKSEVDDNRNFVWSQDSEVQAMAHVWK